MLTRRALIAGLLTSFAASAGSWLFGQRKANRAAVGKAGPCLFENSAFEYDGGNTTSYRYFEGQLIKEKRGRESF